MIRHQPIRVYADTSVFGGVFDAEFQTDSRMFFDQVELGRFQLVVSAIIEQELMSAPKEVRAFFDHVLPMAERVTVSDDTRLLRDAYINSGIVTENHLADAFHVALATVAGCRLIVSWNFRHIVHFDKIPMYNGINKVMGYDEIAIHSPQEVIEYEANAREKDI